MGQSVGQSDSRQYGDSLVPTADFEVHAVIRFLCVNIQMYHAL